MRKRWPKHNEHGSATIWACGLLAVLTCAATIPLALAAVVSARHRAQSAADLAALGAAHRLIANPASACGDAERLAHAHAAAIRSCTATAFDVTVEVAVPLPGPFARFGDAVGRARAGPVTIDDGPPGASAEE